jgi:hypothetical protein
MHEYVYNKSLEKYPLFETLHYKNEAESMLWAGKGAYLILSPPVLSCVSFEVSLRLAETSDHSHVYYLWPMKKTMSIKESER